MKNKLNISALFMTCLMLFSLVVYTSCEKSDDVDTNQMSGEIALNSFGPSPAMRGGELRFIGTNLDQVSSIDLPGAEGITDIKKVSQYEVRITIPQTAQPGYVVLNTSKGEIQTKTPISYQEPISITDFSPKSAKAGDVIKIEGEYLNIIEEIIFADNVHVLKADFVSQSRQVIEVKVPVDAQTGKLIVSDGADILSDGEKIPNWVYSAVDLTVALPEITAVSPKTIKAGQALTITGSLLRLVKSVRFQNADDVNVAQADPTKDITQLSVVVPANAKSGAVTLVLLSGIEVSIGNITLIEPTAAIENVKASYGVDESVVISGTDLDLVVTAAFTNDEAKAVAFSNGKINLKVTAAAQSGGITLTMANGNTVIVDGFVTTKPVAKMPANATPIDELNIESTLGSRVKTVMFGELAAEAAATGTGFKVTVPLAAESGKVTLVLDNGETVDVGSIVINAFTFCAVSEFASESTKVGELLQCSVVNGANLTNVLLNGTDTKYLLVGTVLYVSVGVNVGDNKMTLVSGSTKVDYTIKVMSTGLVETILYNSAIELAAWSKNYELNVDFSGAPADAFVRIRYTKTSDTPQFKAFHGHWGNVYDGSTDGHAEDVAKADYIDLPVSLFPFNDWGYSIILQGDGMIVSSISWVKDYSAPKPIWTGSFDLGGWAGNQDLAWGGFDWSTVKAGQTLHFTFTMNAGNDWGCISLRHGSGWGNLPTEASKQADFGAADTKWAYTLNQADIDDLVANGGLVFTGANLTISQVAIK